MPDALSSDLVEKMDAYWRAANYLSVGQVYLKDNPLLESTLKLEHIKPRLLGHWGTTPGLNFLYVDLNGLIKQNDLNMIYVIGPGHGGPGLVAHAYLEGSYTERYWLDIESAVRHCIAGAGVWRWASNDAGDPDVVMACAGDVPTPETLAAVTLLRSFVPDIRIRVVNVVDLMVLQPQSEHPHGLGDQDFDELFTTDKPVIFAYHGCPAPVHKLTYRRHNHDNIHVRGCKEEGTTTTPFDMVVLNNLDRYQLALDAIQRIPRLSDQVQKATAHYWTTMERHKLYISEHGEDMPEVRDWRWTS
jgi:phosphoketolase